MRSMVHVEIIEALYPIQGADAIECARILGWEVVVKKGEYQVGQKILYCEIDSWIPITVAPFLRKVGNPDRFYNGVNGERLKTVRLRGQISQGLVLPLPIDFDVHEPGTDVTEAMGVQKWEAPETAAQLAGLARGNFPSQLQKTDQDRIQNVYARIKRMVDSGELVDEWIVEEKLEGSSMQVAIIKGVADDGGNENHVLSRNLSLKLDQAGNAFVDLAKRERLIDLVNQIETDYPVISLQGEMIGPGIQGNIYKLDQTEFYLFDIWVGGRMLTFPERLDFIERARELGFNLNLTPLQHGIVRGIFTNTDSPKEILDAATGFSGLNPKQLREGLVFKNLRDGNVTFKAISNEYLLKQKD